MSSLSQRLHLGVQQKQILTPGLVQMVTVLQLNRMELKDMIINEIAENPVLEEAGEAGEELTPGEVQSLLERERTTDPSDPGTGANAEPSEPSSPFDFTGEAPTDAEGGVIDVATIEASPAAASVDAPKLETADPFDEIDFGSFFDDYLDPGFKSPAS